jgi:hypothetical protein
LAVTRALVLLVVGLAAAWLFGLLRFVRAAPIFAVTLPRQAADPPEEHNLGALRFGPTVRASSFHRDPYVLHHPAFLVDERVGPSLLEKWVSASDDPHPWVEISWREPRDLARVVLRHAGAYETAAYTLARYTLTCLRGDDAGGVVRSEIALAVNDNHAAVAIHPLLCPRSRGVRLDTAPGAPGAPVRLYEIEAWGQ